MRGRDPMAVANSKTIADLEFDRLKDLVKGYACSSLGREAIDGLDVLTDRDTIVQGMSEVEEAVSFLDRHGRFSLAGAEDISDLLERADEQALLDGTSLLTVLQTIDATQQVRTRLLSDEEIVSLRQHAERLSETHQLGKRIRQALDADGGVRDDASSALRDLTGRHRTLEARIEKKLRSLIDRNPGLMSEQVITRRSGRLVIPIKSGAVGQMEAIVHDRSATGQTLYAEPSTLVPDNNNLAQLESEIHDERLRVLRELTSAVKEQRSELSRNRAILAHIDSLFARAAYAIAHRCSFPHLTTRISLRHARHPLLHVNQVVPVSLSVGGKMRMTVITGPNTGGKTVTLKTIGLLTLMTQSIIPIPASPDSELPIITKVRTDIGDEQSISQNLSTFSAHMKNIISILETADTDSLILLDELGAGTDPQEGAALGLAIIEALLESEALVAVSTHLTPLKFFAIRHPAVKTASMEFDVQTLSPTFRVIEGVPGKSNAFVIAHQLGLSAELVERARSFLSQGEIRAEDIIEELQRERQLMLEHRQQAEHELAEIDGMKREYREKIEAFEREKEETLSERIKDLDTYLRQSQLEVEQLLAQMNAARTDVSLRNAYNRLAEMRDALSTRTAADTAPDDSQPLDKDSLRIGESVHVRSVDADGRIVHIAPHGKVTIDLSGIRLSTDATDLEPTIAKRETPPSFRTRPYRPHIDSVPLQLNVRGMTTAEALREVEAYLDRLLLADVRHASILHGKGTGVLRDAIRNYLSSCSFVSACGPAPAHQGGDGVTDFSLVEG